MTFIQVPTDQDASGQAAALFAADRETNGYVANFTRLFAVRPSVYEAWRQLNAAIKANMDPYRYELTTLAAARRLRSSYCALAHGKVLRDRFCDAETVRGIADGQARLDPVDAAIVDFAGKAATDAASVTAHDIAALQARGLRDSEILDVALAAAARCFFSTVLDAMGAEPDAAYRTGLEPELQRALAVGRPIAPAGEVIGQPRE
jgi:uncharacterized peroxidase-related enzyme